MNARKLGFKAALRDKLVLAGAGLVLAILAAAAWFLLGDLVAATDNPAARYTHMHCSACNAELPYNPITVGKACDLCEKEGSRYVPTVGSLDEQPSSANVATRIVVFLILAAVLVQGLVYLSVLRLRSQGHAAAARRNRLLVCHCPFCRRKIGYPVTKDGGLICPRCKTGFAPVPLESL